MSIHRFRHRHAGRRGQAMVEFALVIPIFLLMLFGLIDLARIVYANSALSQAAREGARVASVEAYWVGDTGPGCNQPGGPVCPATVADLRADVLDATNGMMTLGGSIADADMHLSCDLDTAPTGSWTSPTRNCNNAANRDPSSAQGNALVSVRVEMEISPITPIIGQLLGALELSGAATMDIN
jgi:TadE-like protein